MTLTGGGRLTLVVEYVLVTRSEGEGVGQHGYTDGAERGTAGYHG